MTSAPHALDVAASPELEFVQMLSESSPGLVHSALRGWHNNRSSHVHIAAGDMEPTASYGHARRSDVFTQQYR